MNNFMKFLKNKNTVTILGVLVCVVILWVAYTMRINQKTKLVEVCYAKETIQPRTVIVKDMIATIKVPESFIKGSYYKSCESVLNKYSNYNTMIAEGSIFYTDLLVDEDALPDAMLHDVNEGERITYLEVDTESTYGNAIMPSDLVDIYVKLYDGDGKLVYGNFYQNIEVLAVKDVNGSNVFERTDEVKAPAYVYFSLEESKYLLFSALNYLKTDLSVYDIEVVLVPNTVEFDEGEEVATEVSSEYLYNFVLDKISMIDDQKETYDEIINEMKQLEYERQQKDKDNDSNDND